MKALQRFSDEYLDSCREMTADQIIQYLDDFRRLHGARPAPSKLISIKVPTGPAQHLQSQSDARQHAVSNPDQGIDESLGARVTGV